MNALRVDGRHEGLSERTKGRTKGSEAVRQSRRSRFDMSEGCSLRMTDRHRWRLGRRGLLVAASIGVALVVPAFGFQEGVPEPPPEHDAKAGFLTAVESARAAHETRLEAAHRQHDRVADALESASAGLTSETRARLREDALGDARRSRDVALDAARTAYSRQVEEAVRGYPAAAVVHGAAREVVEELRAEFEVYKAVLGAAESAVRHADGVAAAAARMDAGRAGNLAELQSRAQAAEAAYKRANSVYEEAVGSGPEHVEARSTAGENFGRFVEGFSSLLAGDQAGAERAAEEARRAREAAALDAVAANAAAEDSWQDAVDRAREARDAAQAAYREATSAASRAAASAAGARAERANSSENQEVALAAQRSAFVDAFRVTRVHDAAELNEVARTLIAGALSAVGELETEALSRLTRHTARDAISAAIFTYSEPKLAVLASLQRVEAEYLAESEAARSAVVALEIVKARNERKVVEATGVLRGIESAYTRAMQVADGALDDGLVSAFKRTRARRAAAIGSAAISEYERSFAAARLSRSRAVQQAFPDLRASETKYPSLVTPGVAAWKLDWGDLSVNRKGHWVRAPVGRFVVALVERYRNARSDADARHREAILDALTYDTANLVTEARRAVGARDSAHEAYDAALEAAQAGTAFREGDRARVRVLAADVHAGLVAAAKAVP